MTVQEAGGYVLAPGDGRARWFLGGLITFKALGEDTGGEYEFVEQSGPRGMGPPLHSHEIENEGFYVVEGEMTFVVGDKRVSASPGSFVCIPRNVAHSFRVDSPTAKFLLVVTPAAIAPFFEELSEPAKTRTLPPPSGPVDAARFEKVARRYGQKILGPPLDT